MREYFPCYNSYLQKIAKLSDQEVGRLFRALLMYSTTGEAQELAGREAVAYDFIADDIDRANKAYSDKCAVNKRNRTSTTVNDRQRPSTTVDETPQNKDKDKDKDEYEDKGKRGVTAREARPNTRFTPPTVDEVRAYCLEKGYVHVNAERFVAYYEANGWKVGRQVMKNWRAAVTYWAKDEKQSAAPQTPTSKAQAFLDLE